MSHATLPNARATHRDPEPPKSIEDRISALEERVAALERSTKVADFPKDYVENYDRNREAFDAEFHAQLAERRRHRAEAKS